MYFYVDESGHTGAHLFDPAQPMLYYGVLSSRLNIDVVSESHVARLRRRLGVERLHGNELGNKGLAAISQDLLAIQKHCRLRFDLYRVAKADHALISFFDQVFDAGLNPAVTWTGYWTPLRYMLLAKVAVLFDDEVLKRAWEARIEVDDERATALLITVCREIRSRVHALPDARSRQLIGDALLWAEQHPEEITYNVKRRSDVLQITPNVIGFQSAMHGIASRLKRTRSRASKIVVDQQSQFNKAQRTLADCFASVRNVVFANGPGLPQIDFTGMPTVPITFASSTSSAGLELADAHLWIFKRFLENKELAPELGQVIRRHMHSSRTDEISINAIVSRWKQWFDTLSEPSPEQLAKAKEILSSDEIRRLKAIRDEPTG